MRWTEASTSASVLAEPRATSASSRESDEAWSTDACGGAICDCGGATAPVDSVCRASEKVKRGDG